MKYTCFIPLFFFLFGCANVQEKHFITDADYRSRVSEQFNHRKTLAEGRTEQLFAVFENPELKLEEREALQFLYAYMPLNDLADYSGDFFLRQVQTAFAAREHFAWGKTVPEDVFRHFVLVYRVNNEDLDDARTVFFNELKDRIAGMTMKDAALEVNHWCHEIVTYRGTDGRTSAPLALKRTSWGRCGEESTFAVTALRAVGIPARQCYTPRWVHTDDNHAWVEVWIDGKWHYMGACEPEPELNIAWFDVPVKRAMMVHTNVFGQYRGAEQKNTETPLYSVINLLSNYTATKTLEVVVVDTDNNPVKGAKVKFKVYNYAELYPIAETTTDSNGKASLVTGFGDLIVWASDGCVYDSDKAGAYGYIKVSANETSVTVMLNRRADEPFVETFELVPPPEQKIAEIAPEKRALNAKRFAQEDSIRNAYMATFINEQSAKALLDEKSITDNNLRKELTRYLMLSQGNYAEIAAFIRKENVESPYFLPFLASLTEKDLRDTPESILADHFNAGVKELLIPNHTETVDFLARYVLSPRIERELLRSWRSFLVKKIEAIKTEHITATNIINWIKENITVVDSENYYNCPLSPRGVYELRHADSRSRNIFFVALCRAAAIPARLEPATEKPQYFVDGQWTEATFETAVVEQSAKALLTFNNFDKNIVKPQYYMHYTLARFDGDDFVTLDYESDAAFKKLPVTIILAHGFYRLMIGSRANDGSVTVNTSYFTLDSSLKGVPKKVTITLPEPAGKMQIMGIVDMNTRIDMTDGSFSTLKELSKGQGATICFIDPWKEPSKHVLQDLPAFRDELETWNGAIVFMIPDDKALNSFDASAFKNLPAQSVFGIDANRTLLKGVANTLQIDSGENFPLTLFLNSNGGILFHSEGYRIGIGENIVKTIRINKETMAQ
ncbi:MAG: Ig-like domain-containing protein [Cytophagaceae bacterium]|jgi:transglutaminase-like putative cysteine protease|nr:Ig-like domain-containing protein [Cytophagaceae bacterium]